MAEFGYAVKNDSQSRQSNRIPAAFGFSNGSLIIVDAQESVIEGWFFRKVLDSKLQWYKTKQGNSLGTQWCMRLR